MESILPITQKGWDKHQLLRLIEGWDGDLHTGIGQGPFTLFSVCVAAMANNNQVGYRICYDDRHRNDNTIDVGWYGLRNLHHIWPIAIRSDHSAVSMSPPDARLCGNLFTQQTGRRSSNDEDGKVMPVYCSKNGWTGFGAPEFTESGVIFRTTEGVNVHESNVHQCGRGTCSGSFVIGNWYRLLIWQQSKCKFAGLSLQADLDSVIELAACKDFMVSSIQARWFLSRHFRRIRGLWCPLFDWVYFGRLLAEFYCCPDCPLFLVRSTCWNLWDLFLCRCSLTFTPGYHVFSHLYCFHENLYYLHVHNCRPVFSLPCVSTRLSPVPFHILPFLLGGFQWPMYRYFERP